MGNQVIVTKVNSSITYSETISFSRCNTDVPSVFLSFLSFYSSPEKTNVVFLETI